MYLGGMQCCGVVEADKIREETPLEIVHGIYEQLKYDFKWRKAFIIFTDHRNLKYGKALQTYIKENKLGRVLQTRAKVNPNTGNTIKVWVWDFSKKGLNKLAAKKKWNKDFRLETKNPMIW